MTRRLHLTKNYLSRGLGVLVMMLGLSLSMSAQIDITFSSEQPTCFGLPNGSITAIPANGTPPYAYLWSTGATSQTISGVPAGNYSVTVFDANSLTGTNAFTLTQPDRVEAVLTTDQNCSAPFDITANPSGGVGPYTYNWSTGAMTQSILNMPDGTYCVTVVDSRLCGVPECITVTTTSPTVNVTANNVTCPGGNDGSLTAIPSGGSAPYSYLWSNGGTSQTITGLTAGTYTVTLTDANGCTATASGTVSQPPALLLNVTANQPDCVGDNDGSISVVASGGTPTYSYLWSTGSTSTSIFNLAPGTYTVTVTDANGCTLVRSIPLTPRSNLTVGAVGTPETCPGFNNGFATANPQNGVMPYTYQWNTGGTQQVIQNLVPGTYTVTVTDAAGCVGVASAIVQAATPLVAVATATSPSTCGVNDGSATVSITSGSGPFTFMWNTGATTQTINGLAAGTYTVTVSDVNDCTTTTSTTVIAPPDVFVNATATPTLCPGSTAGSATANATGGTPPFSYMWSTGAFGQTINNLGPGTYSVTVTDLNGCTDTDFVTIGQAPGVVVNVTGTEIVCGAGNTGSATAFPTSGTAPFNYSWSNGATSQTVSGLAEGVYTVTVTDANGCTGQGSITIDVVDDLSLNLIPRPVLCFGGNSGSILAQVSGGQAPYTYSWSNGAGNVSELLNLTAGTYTLVVTDANGCTATATTTVTQPNQLVANASGTDPLCPGDENGTAQVVTTGGTSPYTYAWNTGENTQSISGLPAGTYVVTVMDANLCMTTASVTLTDPAALSVNVSAPTITCGGTATGSATAIVTGGTGTYTYNWSDGQTTQTAINLTAGSYQLTVTDANGCTQVVPTIVLNELPAVNIDFNVTNIECSNEAIGAITAVASNGTAPYTYNWSNGATTATITGLTAGTYTVTVTDVNGCRAVRGATVIQTAGFTAGAPGTNITCFGFNDGSATAIPNGGQAPFAYDWSNGATTATITDLGPGTYSVTITDANECFATASVVIVEPAALQVAVGGEDIECGDNLAGSAITTVTGGTMPYSYLWSNGATTANLTDLGPGTYGVTVTDANGCTVMGVRTLTAPPVLSVNITQNSGTCTNESAGILVANVLGGTGSYSYNWSNGATTSTISNLDGGVYTVTVTDANGCTAMSTASVTVFPAPSCAVIVDQIADLGDNGQLTVSVTGGTAPLTYDWSNGEDTPTISNLSAGTYTVTVTDANGCQTVCSATLDLLAGIGNYVWEDIDHDGQQDANEPPIPNVTVNLKDANGVVIATTTTDENGEYYFLGLDPGTYSVQFVVPDGMDYTASNQGDDALDSDIVPGMNGMTGTYVLDPGELDFTVDAGLFVPPNGVIVDPCTCLNNNTTEDDGQFDELFQITSYPNETWTVIEGSGLFTTASPAPPALPIPVSLPLVLEEVSPGVYSFNFLIVDEVTYSATITNGFSTLTVSNTCAYPTVNLEPMPPLEFCITDDGVVLGGSPTEPGTLTFTLNGEVVNEIEPADLELGVYDLVATFSPDDPTVCEVTLISTVTIHDDCVAKLGDYVWEDIDHDGQQDADEPAIPNITVNLKDATGTVIDQTTTDENGMYCFYPLNPGTYSVQFVVPDTLDYTASNQGDDALDSDIIPGMNGMTHTVTLGEGDEDLTIDGGLYVPPNGVIGDPCSCLNNSTTEDNGQFNEVFTVRSYPNETWTVIDGTGMWTAPNGEPPVLPVPVSFPQTMVEVEPGVYDFTFRLVDEIAYTVVTTNGFDTLTISNVCEYPTLNIDELPPMEYCLADAPIELGANPTEPGNLVFTVNGEVTTVIDPITLDTGSYELIAQLIPLNPMECEARVVTQFVVNAECLATVGDRVWLDLNCDGIQGGNEPGVPGVEVTITGTAEFLDPNVNMTTYTDANGNYEFMVPPGNYKLTFGQVAGYELTAPNQGGNDELDSDVNPVTLMTEIFHLDPYEENLSFDMGLCPECINIDYPGAIGYDQYLCAPGNDPEPFVSLDEPSGGDGPIEYLWMSTAGSPNTPIQTWQPIPNTNSPTYDPGPVFQTTYFARCARVQDCGPFLESNILTVTVGDEAGGDIFHPGIACYNEPVRFEAVNLTNGGSVQWNFGPNATPSTAYGRVASTTFSGVGYYDVEMIVTVGDCSAYVYDRITISALPTVCNQGMVLGSTVTDNAAGQVMLDWEMSADFEPLTYVVEYSENGADFAAVGEVTEETLRLNGIRYYEYETTAPKKGRSYYRVKVVDSAGNSIHSNVEEVIIFTESKIAMLYPNPVENQLTVEIFDTFDAQEVVLDIFSVSGKLMASLPVEEGAKNVQFDMSTYPAGAYLVRLRLGETSIRTMKVIKR